MNERSNKNKFIFLIAALVVFTGLFLLFGHYKAYLYEDEVLSYTAANSQDGMRPSFPINTVTNGGEFVKNAITVRPDKRFDFANAIKNTSKDPHPPLYLIMLNAVSSLFPGVFSKWFALSINFVFGAITVILLYFLGEKLYEGKGPAVSFIYVFSVGFITQLMNLRMYVVLQAFTMWLTLQYVMMIKDPEGEGSLKKKRIVLLILNVVLGTMTHYYFLIFAFFEAAIYSFMLIKKKDIRGLIKHTLSYVLSGIITLIIFSPIIWQLTGSDVGSESFASRGGAELARRIRVMLSHLNNEIYGGQLKFYLLVLVIFLIFLLIKGKRAGEKILAFGNIDPLALFIVLTSCLYFLTVSFTTPYLTGRYLSPIYPLCAVITYLAFKGLINTVFKSEVLGAAVLVVIMAIPLYLWISGGLFDYNKAAMQELSMEHSGDICVFFRGISAEENYFELENYDRILAMRLKPKEGEKVKDLNVLQGEERIVVYVPNDKDPEEYFERIRKYNPSLTKTERLYKAYYSDVYIMSGEKAG